MKKTLLVILVFFAAMTAKAQWYVGGNLNGEFFESHNTLSISPDFGYTFENAPLGVGLSPEFCFHQDKLNGDSFTLEKIVLSPYLRYYCCDVERLSFFVDLSGDINVYGEKGFDVGFSPGVSFDLTEHWSAEFSYGWIGYEQFEEKGFCVQMDASTTQLSFYYNF